MQVCLDVLTSKRPIADTIIGKSRDDFNLGTLMSHISRTASLSWFSLPSSVINLAGTNAASKFLATLSLQLAGTLSHSAGLSGRRI